MRFQKIHRLTSEFHVTFHSKNRDGVILVSFEAVFLAASRNVPPHKRFRGGALRDDAKNGCEGG